LIQFLVKLFLNKDIILFNPHRNSSPLLNADNKKKYVFIDPNWIWKITFIFGRNSKLRDIAFVWILNIINPIYIIDINWITHLQTIYYVWCKNNGKKFIVIQHGTYVAGVVTDAAHKFTKCQEFWVWSHYFKNLFEENNKGKKVNFKIIGNPVYNQFDRNKMQYKSGIGMNILIAPSLVKDTRYEAYENLINKLSSLGFEITVKPHLFQNILSKNFNWEYQISGNFYDILNSQKYDIILTDVSSAMNDIVFFKNKVIYFSPAGLENYYTENIYSIYLENLASSFETITQKEEIFKLVNINNQERLLTNLIIQGNNIISN
jgi:hypothetical protein